MPRLFIAIDLPESIKESLLKLVCKIPGARWSNREQLHLTLTFIGEVSNDQIPLIDQSLALLFAESFSLQLSSVGTFPNSKSPKILWVGVQLIPSLQRLKQHVDIALKQAISFVPEERDYHPHLTIARLQGRSSPEFNHFLKQHENLQFTPFLVQQFHLYSSQLLKTGAEYRCEKSYLLR